MKILLLAPLAAALLAAAAPLRPRSTGTCRPVSAFSNHFSRWVSHTVRDTSWYAIESRDLAGLSHLPGASSALVSEPGVCATLAMQFARAIPGRDTVNTNDIIAVTVDSAYYVVTDLGGGGQSAMNGRDANGNLIITTGKSDFVDAITIDRTLVTTKAWRWEQLPGRPVPYH